MLQKIHGKTGKIQCRVTKIIPRLKNKTHEERLEELNLFSLTKRRIRRALIEVFKIFKGYSNLNVNNYFNISIPKNNGCKIIRKRFKSHEAKYFFFNRIVNIWNTLPSEILNSSSIPSFKRKIDKYLKTNPQQTLFLSE